MLVDISWNAGLGSIFQIILVITHHKSQSLGNTLPYKEKYIGRWGEDSFSKGYCLKILKIRNSHLRSTFNYILEIHFGKISKIFFSVIHEYCLFAHVYESIETLISILYRYIDFCFLLITKSSLTESVQA